MTEAATQWRQRSPADPMPADLALAEAMLGQKRAAAAVQQLTPYVRNWPATRPSEDGKSIVLPSVMRRCCASMAGLLSPPAGPLTPAS